MVTKQRPLRAVRPTAEGRAKAALPPSPRRWFRHVLPWQLLGVAAFCLALAGCSVVGSGRGRSENNLPSLTEPLTQRRRAEQKPSLLGSWLRPKEPAPPESVDDFLAMPRVRP